MRKKLLAGVMALALCSTNMPLQTIFAGEFTSGNLEEVSEETPEIFSDDNQEVIEETEEELSVFSSENVPDFSSEANVMSATADGTEPIKEININDTNSSNLYDKNEHKWKITSAGSYKFNGTGATTSIPIIIESITSGTVNIPGVPEELSIVRLAILSFCKPAEFTFVVIRLFSFSKYMQT